MKPVSLLWRIVLLAVPVIVAVSILGIATMVRERLLAREHLFHEYAHGIILALRPTLDNALVVGDLATAEQAMAAIATQEAVQRLVLLSGDGQRVLVAAEHAVAPPPDVPAWFRRLFGIVPITEQRPIRVGGVDYGVLRLEMSDGVLLDEIWFAAGRFLLTGLVCLAGIVALLRVALRRGLAPLEQLAAGAHRLAAGDLSTRVPALAVPEFAELGFAFNAMLEQIDATVGELRRGEERLREAQRIAHLGDWTWDIRSGEQTWSEESFRIFGYAPGAVAASYELFMSLLLPEDREGLATRVRRAIDGNEPYACEFRIRRPDGSIRHILGQAEVVRDGAGEAWRMVGTNLDITDRKRAEEEIHALNRDLEHRVAERTAELETANKELEAFSYSVSHDLRAPLRAIDGFSRILTEEYYSRFDDEGRRYLDIVRRNAIRMGDLIDDILDFSRMSRREMALSPLDLAALAREVFEEVSGAVPERKIELRLGDMPPARGDRAMLRQVLVNLVSNAVKFTAPRVEAVIEVAGVVDGDMNRYWVKDNGVGFDMQYVDKLFGAFQRLHGADEFEGTGIGLAIVKRVIDRHGGRAWAEGQLGAGAAFYFLLPRGDRV